MLSRMAMLSAQRPIGALMARTTASAAASAATDQQFQRPVRPIYPGKVRMGFIPDEWFTFFYKKTGVTGPYMFGTSFLTYLCSKEVYVMEHEFYTGVALAIIWVWLVKKLGPQVAAYCDKEIDQIEEDWNSGRNQDIKHLNDLIEFEKKEQWRSDGQLLLMEAKKENVALQLEATYRERIARVFSEVKRRLDYQVECQNVERRVNQKHMVNWIVNNVLKGITPEQEKETLNKCILDLNSLAKA